jgi:hypothetical protein
MVATALSLTIAAFARRWPHLSPLRSWVLCGIVLGAVGAMAGCESGPMQPSTPTGTSQVVVTATSGSITQSTTIALTVQ